MRRLILLAAALLSMTSCATVRYASRVPDVTFPATLTIVEPLSSISSILDDGTIVISDSLSALAEGVTRYVLSESIAALPVDGLAPVDGDDFLPLYDAVNFMASASMTKKELDAAIPPKAVLDYMAANGLGQAGFFIESGYGRSSRNMAKETVKSVILGVASAVLTLGTATFFSIPTKNYDRYSLVVVDADSERILYRNTLERSNLPYDLDSSREMVTKLLGNYLKAAGRN